MARKNSNGAQELVTDVLKATEGVEVATDAGPILTPAERMAKAREGRKVGKLPRTNRVLYLIEQTEPGKDRIIRSFPNKFRLRKWLDVAEDVTPGIRDRVYVIRGRGYTLKETIGA
jgi:hypothetical protein